MPPKRRSTGRTSAATIRQQSTLSFHGKANKVTKPSQQAPLSKSAKPKKDPALVDDEISHEIVEEPDLDEPTTAEKAIQHQTDVELDALDSSTVTVEDVLGGRAEQSEIGATGGKGSGWVGDEEEKARKVSEAQIRRYWKEKESERLVPRVHQEGLGVHEKILREWDVSGQYGPCIGIARLKRWKRANVLGLSPPVEVLAVLLWELDNGESKSQRAHVDELMSSRFVET